jgi:hypothetical protein
MNFVRSVLALVVVVAVAAGGVGIAVASSSSPPAASSARVVSARSALRTFRVPAADAAVSVETQQWLRSMFASAPAESMVAHADFERTQAVPVANSSMTAWVAPSGENVCMFIADPAGGAGATCSTPDQIKAGHAIAILGRSAQLGSHVVVVVVSPDGAAPPRLTSASGKSTPISGTGNVAASLAPADATVNTSSESWPLSRFAHASTAAPSSTR